MHMKYHSTLHSRRDSETNSCVVVVNKFSELLLDMAWLLKQPIVQDMECDMMSSQLQRFTFLLNFLIEYESIIVLKRVLDFVKIKIIKNGDMVEFDRTLIQETMNHATEVLNQRLEKNNMQISENVGLLTADCVMSVTPYKEEAEKPSNRMFTYYNTNRLFTPRPVILAVALVAVCFGICAVVFHPQKATGNCHNFNQ